MRIREESRTNTAVHDPTSGHARPRSTSAVPRSREREVELFRDKLLYLARGADIVVFAGSLPRGVDSAIYAELIPELRRLGVTTVVDAEGEPMRLALRAEPDVISPNVLEAEELVGHEFNDEQDRVVAARELLELGAREAIVTLPDGCVGERARRRAPGAAPASGSPRARPSRRSAPATRSSPATSPRATRARRRRSACATASPAAPSRRSASAPGSSIPQGVERLLAEVDVEPVEASTERRLSPQIGLSAPVPGRGARCYPRSVAAAARHASQHPLSTPSARGRFVRPRA